MLVFHQAAAEQPAMVTSGFDSACVDKNVAATQLRRKNAVDEPFLRLAFDNDVEPDQREGLPPMTFFSQSSDNV